MTRMKKRAVLLCLLLAATMSCFAPMRAAATSLDLHPDEEYVDDDDDDDYDYDEEEEEEESPRKSQYEDELDELNDQIEELQKKQTELQQQLNAKSSELEKKMYESSTQDAQIAMTKERIGLLSEKIAKLNQRIAEKEREVGAKQAEIDAKQKEIDYNFDQYKKRMRASYMAGEASTLSMLLGAADFTDFLMRSEFVRATAAHDQQLVATLRADREKLEQARKELEQAQAELQESKKDIEAERLVLEETKKEQEAIKATLDEKVQDLEAERLYYQQNKAAVDAEMKKAEQEVAAIYERLKPKMKETFVGGVWAWPLPGHTQITSAYAANDRSDNHTGTDIAGGKCYGKSIVAANDGTVVLTKSGNTGYGNYVIVDHGGGYSSLYAHMSSISVSEGQEVRRGETEIGKVGSTGWATGPHLHFEVRINGKPTNPMAFIS